MADEQEQTVEQATLWQREGKRFVVIRTHETTKDSDAANWSQAIAYQDEAAQEPIRNRTLKDFLDKFTPVK